METSYKLDIKKSICKKARLFLIILLLSVISATIVKGQPPTWVPGTPSLGAPGAITIPINYGINKVGIVYVICFNYNHGSSLMSSEIRAAALAGPGGGRTATAVIPVTAGNINLTLQHILNVPDANRLHTLYIVAEGTPGGLQAVPVRLNFTTLPCPKIQLFTFFGNNGECINLGAFGVFQAALLGATPSGVLSGTRWTIDWGDGSPVYSYISTADNDIPVVPQHLFTSIASCNYSGTWTIQNPCGEFLNGSSVFVVHGRDILADGDGLLQMEEITTHTPNIIYVCEGQEHNITLADISLWNCQNPFVPPPLTTKPNLDPRTIQFVYGETPAGAVMNTITGDVMIGGTNIANGANGYEGPIINPVPPPNPNTQTDIITIPATCVVGQRFYVYLKNWNKCNPYTGNPAAGYEFEDFIIEVIDAPPPPIVTTPQNYCFGSVPATISATPNLAGNTINWYGDAGLTNLLYTGVNYAHGQTAVGTYDYWVTETSIGNGCEGPPAQITMNIVAVITNNSVAAAQTICYNTPPANLTGTLPGGGNGSYTYLWESSTVSAVAGFGAAPGMNTGQNYSSAGNLTQTTWYRRTVTSGPCTHISTAIQITVYANPTPGTVQSAQSICYNTAPAQLTQGTAPAGGTGTM